MIKLIQLLFLFSILGLFTGCGKEILKQTDIKFENKTNTVKEKQKFEGLFFFDLGGEVELIQDSRGQVDFVMVDELTTINPENQTNAFIPRFNISNLVVHNGKLTKTLDVNYTSGADIEEDITGNNINGRKRTDIEITKEGNKIRLKLKIYDNETNNNANFIVAEREFLSDEGI